MPTPPFHMKQGKTGEAVELTGMSQMEQDGAWREAEVGDVGSKFKPLDKRGKTQTIRSFVFPLVRAANKGAG